MKDSKIEWTHHTFNPWIGCTKVGPGCDHCYAEADFDKRRHVVQWGAGNPRKRTTDANWHQPVKWNKEAERLGIRYRVFCASLADVFDNEVDPDWRADLFDLIANTPHLDWLLVTKRIGNAERMMNHALADDGPHWPWENLWIGATITNQEEADRDIPKLLATSATVRFVSIEPLLGPIDLINMSTVDGLAYNALSEWGVSGTDPLERRIDWVIVGGESGKNARPMRPEWARSLRDQCDAAGVPFLFKQWGEWYPNCFLNEDGSRDESTMWMDRIGKKAAGRLLDGATHDGFPQSGGFASA